MWCFIVETSLKWNKSSLLYSFLFISNNMYAILFSSSSQNKQLFSWQLAQGGPCTPAVTPVDPDLATTVSSFSWPS